VVVFQQFRRRLNERLEEAARGLSRRGVRRWWRFSESIHGWLHGLPRIAATVDGYKERCVSHNTYLELLVEQWNLWLGCYCG